VNKEERERNQAIKRASELKALVEDELLQKPNVVGVGVGLRQKGGAYTDEIALVVMVRKKVPTIELEPEDRIPEAIEDVPIDVLEVGELFAEGDATVE
jgi:hypothetical protein